MEAKEKLLDFKDKAINSLETWVDGRIDDFVTQNPNLKTASIYMKRGAKNYLARERGKIENTIDNAALFICDEEGNIDEIDIYKYTPYTCASNESTHSANVLFLEIYNGKMLSNFPL